MNVLDILHYILWGTCISAPNSMTVHPLVEGIIHIKNAKVNLIVELEVIQENTMVNSIYPQIKGLNHIAKKRPKVQQQTLPIY